MICHAQKCLINHALLSRYARRNFEEKRQKRKHLSNLSPHLFCKFSHQVTLSRSSFIQQILFVKKLLFFLSFSNTIYFLLATHLYSRQNIIITFFFINFRLTLKNIFFEENEYDTHLLNFFFSKINYPITRKEQNEKPFFCIFFQEFKTHFLF